MSPDSTTEEPVLRVNTSSPWVSEDEILGTALVWTFLILRALQGILGMLGNLVTIFVVFQFELLWENSGSRMIASLALADFFGGVNPFFSIIARYFTSSISVLNALCYVQIVTRLLTGYGNLYCTLLCTVDRYIFITRPLRYVSIVTVGKASWAILITWLIICLQIALVLGLGPGVDAEFRCRYADALPKWAVYGTGVLFLLITFCIIVPMYGVIAYESWKADKNEPHITNYPPESQPIQKAKLRERKMIKTVGLVLGTYLICYIPFFLYHHLTRLLYVHYLSVPFAILLFRRILNVLYNMQALLNPFLYGWKNNHFKKAYKKLLPQSHQVTHFG